MSDEDWRQREVQRFGDGTYQSLPWRHEVWWWNSECHYNHYAHMSLDDPTIIAYTPSDEYGRADRQIRIRPGKYLGQFFPELPKSVVQAYAEAINGAAFDGPLLFATTADEIEGVYRYGPASCMSMNFPDIPHPTRAYAAGDLAVAYIRRDTRIVGRALVWPDKLLYSRIYGDEACLVFALERAGFKAGPLSGARIQRIPCPCGCGGLVLPYIDYTPNLLEVDSHLIIDRDGDIIAMSTSGVVGGCSGDNRECYACGRNTDPDELYNTDDHEYCAECYRGLFATCYDCGEEHPRDNMESDEGDLVCSDCFDDRERQRAEEEEEEEREREKDKQDDTV